MGQKVLVIGSGAREHAIAHALLRGDSVSEVTVASGNPGMELDGIRIPAPELSHADHASAVAYVRPHDLDVSRDTQGASGIVAQLQRAIVVGPVARLELWPVASSMTPQGHDPLIEVSLTEAAFRALDLKEGEKLRVSPRKARVFLRAETGLR